MVEIGVESTEVKLKPFSENEAAKRIARKMFTFNGRCFAWQGERPSDVKKVNRALHRLASNPQLLLSMPLFPEDQSQAEVASEEFDDWAQKAGFENSHDLYGDKVSVMTIRHMGIPDWTMPFLIADENLPRYSNEPYKYPIHTILESMRFTLEEKLFCERKLYEARGFLLKHLPIALPKEPTEVIVSHHWGIRTCYLGKLRGRRIIAISEIGPVGPIGRGKQDSFRNPYRSIKTSEIEEKVTLDLVEELIHQRHAEEVTTSDVFNDLDPFFQGKEPPEDTDRLLNIVFAHLDPSLGMPGYYPRFLGDTVAEGVGVLGRLYVVNKELDLAKRDNNDRRVQFLENYKGIVLHWLKYRTGRQGVVLPRTADHGIGTLKLMKGLYYRFGLVNLPEIISYIDLNACAKIMLHDGFGHLSLEVKPILDDPRLLPGLERCPLIKESLGKDANKD